MKTLETQPTAAGATNPAFHYSTTPILPPQYPRLAFLELVTKEVCEAVDELLLQSAVFPVRPLDAMGILTITFK